MKMFVVEDINVRCTPNGVIGERHGAQSIAVERQFAGNKVLSARLSDFDEIL